jgi:predicted RNA-binding Zn-ribbon protein involved in translation (DUF1610 family)
MVSKNNKSKPVRSIEYFHHFRCGHCNGWWGIGDAPMKRKKWFCPWCGKENIYKKATKVKDSYNK